MPATTDLSDRLIEQFERTLDLQLAQGERAIEELKGMRMELQAMRMELADKPGSWTVRMALGAWIALFTVMLLAFLQSRGVDTTQVVRDAVELSPATAAER